MSTSDQQGNQPLTRKQLREIRLTGATPVISEEESEAAAVPPAPLPRAAAPVEAAQAPTSDADVDLGATPLTRRQVREQERLRTASVGVIAPMEESDREAEDVDASIDDPSIDDAPHAADELVSGVPDFAPDDDDIADEASADDDVAVLEVAESHAGDIASEAVEIVDEDDADTDSEAVVDDISELGITGEEAAVDDADGDESSAVDDPIATGERPVVSPTFGNGLLRDKELPAFSPSFDDLITSDSGGSQHLAPNTLIFTPSAGEGSLSGPVASTGEVLITGSYDLPRGMGSQGHAHGTADGKEADAVLIDGELPASSSPTPIAASSAISTTKPAGEVIRPPAPEKGNKLMLTLAITAGGLALALAVVLIVAFTTNVV